MGSLATAFASSGGGSGLGGGGAGVGGGGALDGNEPLYSRVSYRLTVLGRDRAVFHDLVKVSRAEYDDQCGGMDNDENGPLAATTPAAARTR